VAETSLGTFDVGEPTNMLILEWNEYSATESSTQPCSMQVVLYDVTNEFEFHYDDSCGVNDIVGLTGHRKDSTDYSDIRNVATTDNGNPHSFNIRVTNGADGYAYEYFDLGISNPGYLPQAHLTELLTLLMYKISTQMESAEEQPVLPIGKTIAQEISISLKSLVSSSMVPHMMEAM